MSKRKKKRNYQCIATHFKDIERIIKNTLNFIPMNFTTKMKWMNYTKEAKYQNQFKKTENLYIPTSIKVIQFIMKHLSTVK